MKEAYRGWLAVLLEKRAEEMVVAPFGEYLATKLKRRVYTAWL